MITIIQHQNDKVCKQNGMVKIGKISTKTCMQLPLSLPLKLTECLNEQYRYKTILSTARSW